MFFLFQEVHDKAIFPLYKSYETDNGRELVTDKRQNALNKSSIKYFAVFALLIVGFSLYKLIGFFTPPEQDGPKVEQTLNENKEIESIPLNNQPQFQVIPPLSTQWRITGELQKSGKAFVILADNKGNLRLEPRSNFNFTGRI